MAKNEHGLKTSAGMRMSKLLRQVGSEHTELSYLDAETGEARPITKFEALARTIWKLALGYEEDVEQWDAKKRTMVRRKKKYQPDRTCIQLIYDRMEGRVAQQGDGGPPNKPLSTKISDQARKRVNELAEE